VKHEFNGRKGFFAPFAPPVLGDEDDPIEIVERLRAFVGRLTEGLVEYDGRNTWITVKQLLWWQFPDLDQDTVDSVCRHILPDPPRIIKKGFSYLLTSITYAEIANNVPRPVDKMVVTSTIKALYGYPLTPLVDQLAGHEGYGGLGIVEAPSIDVYNLVPGLTELERSEMRGRGMLQQGFLDTVLRAWDHFSATVTGMMDNARRSMFSAIVSERCLAVSYKMVEAYVTSRTIPFSYDDFDESMVNSMAWFLGALACEGTIIEQNGDWRRIRVGPTNPLVFFQKALPLTRHPSMQSAEMTLSPAFVSCLRTIGMVRSAPNFFPVRMNDDSSRELFLAGLLDTRGVLCFDGNSGKKMKFRAIIDVPYDTADGWLDLVPVTMPLEISAGIDLSDRNRERFCPSTSILERDGAILHVFGRRHAEGRYATEGEEVQDLARALKYIYESILPLCVHPRISYFLDLAMYIEDDYGQVDTGPSFPRALRAAIEELGGLDTRRIQDNLKHRILDPDTGEVWLFLPPWLRDFMAAKGVTADDLMESCKLWGKFVPFPRAIHYSPLLDLELPARVDMEK
jgi:hypothetical protein